MSALGGRPRSVALCGIQFLPHRSTAISNWQLLIQTVCVQLLFRVAVLLAAGSRWKSRHALTCVRRIGAIGLPTPNIKWPANLFCSQFCPHVVFSWAGRGRADGSIEVQTGCNQTLNSSLPPFRSRMVVWLSHCVLKSAAVKGLIFLHHRRIRSPDEPSKRKQRRCQHHEDSKQKSVNHSMDSWLCSWV